MKKYVLGTLSAKTGVLLAAQNPGFCAACAAIERHSKRFSRFGGKNPAVFNGACSNYILRSAKKNGKSRSTHSATEPPSGLAASLLGVLRRDTSKCALCPGSPERLAALARSFGRSTRLAVPRNTARKGVCDWRAWRTLSRSRAFSTRPNGAIAPPRTQGSTPTARGVRTSCSASFALYRHHRASRAKQGARAPSPATHAPRSAPCNASTSATASQ